MSTVFTEHHLQPPEGIERWIEKWKTEYKSIVQEGRIQPIEGFLAFNARLNELHIPKIIATGSHKENAWAVLKSFGISSEFPIIGIEDVKHGKPHPELFMVAAAELKTPPQECIVFEDSPAGIIAARKARMRCVALSTTFSRAVLEKEKPEIIIPDFTKITPEDFL